MLFIRRFRPDIQYAVKDCSRGMACPTAGDFKRVKRIARYLRDSRNIEQHIVADKAREDLFEVYCDSDWAFDKITRKSTTGVVVKWAGGFVGTLSRAQGSVATSSTEAEGYALSSGGTEGLGLRSLLLEMGVETQPVKLELYSDSPGAISAQSRLGLGKTMKHVEIRHLFLQELVRIKRVTITKVNTLRNEADLMTKYLAYDLMSRHMVAIGLQGLPSRRGEELQRSSGADASRCPCLLGRFASSDA